MRDSVTVLSAYEIYTVAETYILISIVNAIVDASGWPMGCDTFRVTVPPAVATAEPLYLSPCVLRRLVQVLRNADMKGSVS